MVILGQPHREYAELVVAREHRVEGRQVPKRFLPSLARGRQQRRDAQRERCPRGCSGLWAASRSLSENSPCAFLSSRRMTSLRSSTLLLAALAPAPDSKEAVSRPLITRVKTPTLKNEMNFSCASISLRAEEVDFTLHVEHKTLSQSSVSKFEKRHGRDASGVVFKENIWICRLPTCTWSLCHATRLLYNLPVHAGVAAEFVLAGPLLQIEADS